LSGTIKETHPILPFLNRVFTFFTPLSLAFCCPVLVVLRSCFGHDRSTTEARQGNDNGEGECGEKLIRATTKQMPVKAGRLPRHVKNVSPYNARLLLNGDTLKASGIASFESVAKSIAARHPYILHYFDNKSTNASAESFNAKLKPFRSVFRDIRDT